MGEYARRNEFAQSSANLLGFPAGKTDCHTSSPQSPPCSPPPEGQRRSNAPLWLLSPQRVPLCGAPLHWFAMTCRNLLRVSGCRNMVRNDMQKPETFLRVQGRPPPLSLRGAWRRGNSVTPAAGHGREQRLRRMRKSATNLPEVVPICQVSLRGRGLPHQCAHWFAMACRNLLRVSGCKNMVRNDMQKTGAQHCNARGNLL